MGLNLTVSLLRAQIKNKMPNCECVQNVITLFVWVLSSSWVRGRQESCDDVEAERKEVIKRDQGFMWQFKLRHSHKTKTPISVKSNTNESWYATSGCRVTEFAPEKSSTAVKSPLFVAEV